MSPICFAAFFDPARLEPNEPRLAIVTGQSIAPGHACLTVLNNPERDCYQRGMPPVTVHRLVPIIAAGQATPSGQMCCRLLESPAPDKVVQNARSRHSRSPVES